MKNDFEIRGNDVAIFLKDGSEAIIDRQDLDRVAALPGTWCATSCGKYVRMTVNYEEMYLHRFIVGTPPDLECDHIDRNPRNNKRSNLRNVTRAENMANKGIYRSNVSGIPGVSWSAASNKWRVRINRGGRRISLGLHDTAEAAAEAIAEFERGAPIRFASFIESPSFVCPSRRYTKKTAGVTA